MSTKIFVDNLAPSTTENELMDLFSPFGNVTAASIAVDDHTHKSRGFGFVTMVTPEGARTAIEALNGKVIGAFTLSASEARPDEQRIASSGERRPRRNASCLF